MKYLIAILLVLLLIAPPAWAVTETVGNNTGDDYSGTDDGQIKQTLATTNYGSSTTMEITKWAAGDHIHSLVKFTGLSSIGGPVTVTSATLYIYLSTGAANRVMEARRLLRDWVENQATWNIWSTSNNWTTAGGLSDGNDRSATISGSVNLGSAGAYYGITGSQLATDVENIINGINSNYGWHVSRQGVGEDSTGDTFATSEGTDGQRPYLEITYTVAASRRRGVVIIQ